MYKSLLLLALALLLIAAPARAQDVPSHEAVPDPMPTVPRQHVVSAITGQLPADAPSVDNNARSMQDLSAFWPLLGSAAFDVFQTLLQNEGNAALVSQEGAHNTAEITQRGRANAALMIQQGTGNTSRLLQDGTHNVYGAWLQGDDNYLDVEQVGHQNTYLFGFQGNNLNHSVQQVGTNIQATQIGTSQAPFSIQQQGHGMDIVIRHNGAQ